MEDFICCVVSSHNPNEDHRPPGEGNDLPAPSRLPCPVTHHLPVSLIDRHLYIVTVAPVITVPQQQPHAVQAVGMSQLHHDSPTTKLVASVTTIPVVVRSVAIQQGVKLEQLIGRGFISAPRTVIVRPSEFEARRTKLD